MAAPVFKFQKGGCHGDARTVQGYSNIKDCDAAKAGDPPPNPGQWNR